MTAADARAEPQAAVFIGATDGVHAQDERHGEGRKENESRGAHAGNL